MNSVSQNWLYDMKFEELVNYVSQFTVKTYCFADGR